MDGRPLETCLCLANTISTLSRALLRMGVRAYGLSTCCPYSSCLMLHLFVPFLTRIRGLRFRIALLNLVFLIESSSPPLSTKTSCLVLQNFVS